MVMKLVCVRAHACACLCVFNRPTICAKAGAGSMIAFALPLSYCFGMLWGYGLGGVWVGMAAGWYLCGAIFAVVLYKTDWVAEAKMAVAKQAAS